LDAGVGGRDPANGHIVRLRLDVEILGKIGRHDMPGICRENLASTFEAPGHES